VIAVSTPRGEWTLRGLVLVFLPVWTTGITAKRSTPDPFLTDVEAAASLAAADSQLIAFTDMSGGSVPELEGDTVPIRSSTVVVENLAASEIGAREDQLNFRHLISPPVPSPRACWP
jgi:hypothetical protein